VVNVALAIVFSLAAGFLVYLVNATMRQHALFEAEAKARLLLDRNLATHAYFTHDLKPRVFELADRVKPPGYFEPAWMSSTYAIRLIDGYFDKLSPTTYYYKEAALNARSPENEADPLEAAFLRELNRDPALGDRSLVRMIGDQPFLTVLRRGEVMQAECLRCHQSPARAPADLVARYGALRSFGRSSGEVVSAVSIRVPLAGAYAAANRFSFRLSGWLLATLAGLFTIQALLYRRMVGQPLRRIQAQAVAIAADPHGVGGQVPAAWGGEFHELVSAFNAMSVSLQEMRDDLESRVRERTAALQALSAELAEDVRRRQQIEAQLRGSEAQYRALIERVPAVVYTARTDAVSSTLFISPQLQDVLGFSPAEWTQAPDAWTRQLHPDDRERVLAELERCRQRGERIDLEYRMLARDGRTVWIRDEASVLGPGSGGPCLMGIMTDITARKRVEAELGARTRQVAAVAAVSDEITKELDLPAVLRLIQRRAMELLGGGAGVLYLWEEQGQALRPVAWTAYGDAMAGVRLRLGEGVVGTVAERRAGMIVNDYRASPLALPFVLAREDITATLAEPVVYGDALFGVIVVNNDRRKPAFDDEDQKLLRLFAGQAAIAIANARLFGQLRQRNEELQALLTVTATVSRSLDTAAIAEAAVRATVEVLRVDAGRLYIFDEPSQALRLFAQHGFPAYAVEAYASYAPGEGVIGRIFQTAEPVCFSDLTADGRYAEMARSRLGVRLGFRSAGGLPILVQGRPVGVIYVFGRAVRPFPPEDLALLAAIGNQVGVAIENARLHATVRRHAEELEARVERRTAELRQALQVKADFLARMSHELRTPLNFVLGFAGLLKDGSGGGLTDKQAHFVERIRLGGQQLLALITDILNLAESSGDGGLRLESLPLRPLVQAAVELLAVQAGQKQLSVRQEIAPEARVVADRRKLLQILRMLLHNAVKFTPPGGQVTVRAGAVPPDGDGGASAGRVEIRVQDTGIGISPGDLERVFGDFEQADSSATRPYPGAGIGLALVRTLVEQHGGRVWAESGGPGQGTAVVVQLPSQVPPPARRVLVVEQEAALLRALAAALQEAGYAVEGMPAGRAALARLAVAPPDLLVLALDPSDVESLEVLRRVRGAAETFALPVLALGGPGPGAADEATALGADEFLTKPVSPSVVVRIVRDLFDWKAVG
jgi:PAS domain S-box-containing protein